MSDNRREKIMKILSESTSPVSGTRLATQLGVSRQVIVQDVAILRAGEVDILATPQGYVLPRGNGTAEKAVLAVKHLPSSTRKELNILVDHGLKVVDVIVEHPIYGELKGYLMLDSRQDADRFLEKLERKKATLLSSLTGGVHLHTVEYKYKEDLDKARAKLKEYDFLAE